MFYPPYNPPRDPDVAVIYRDEEIIVLDKPSGLLSVPARDPALHDSLLTRVRQTWPTAHAVNRLDMDTSGVVLMALTSAAHSFTGRQFEARTTKKSYIGVAYGHVAEEAGLIDLPLAADPDNKPRHRIDHDHGKPSQTRWQVIARVDLPVPATRLALFPLTGRTHQLRVHLKAMGHTLLGDDLYAEPAVLAAAPRLMLHAQELAIIHPNGQPMTFTALCPF